MKKYIIAGLTAIGLLICVLVPFLLKPDTTLQTTTPSMTNPSNTETPIQPTSVTEPTDAKPPVDESEDVEPPVDEPEDVEPPVDEPEDMEPPVDEPEDVKPPVDEPEDVTPPVNKPEDTEPPVNTEPSNPAEVELSISTETVKIEVGKTRQLTVSYNGTGTLRWRSNAPSVVTVSDGLVTAIGAGKAVITVTDGNKSATCNVTVNEPSPYSKPTIIIPIMGSYYIWLGEGPVQLNYKYDGNISDLTWLSYTPEIATVDQNGVVTPVSEGLGCIVLYAGPDENKNRSVVIVEVGDSADKTTAFDLSISNPLYDGVTKYAGNNLVIKISGTDCLKADGTRNNCTDPARIASSQSNPSQFGGSTRRRNYIIKSSNPDVISVTNGYDCGWFYDYLHFNKAGTSVITITSWDGYIESYTIYVKDEYDCYPGKSKLTPGEFAYYATMVGVEDGQKPDYHPTAYLYLYLTDEQLTWERAKGIGHWTAEREFYLNKDGVLVLYAGWDEEVGKHLFYHGGGETASYIAPYTPPTSNSGPIRFPNSSISMMERTMQLVEVLGDTSGEFVTYTSSDTEIVNTSGGLLLARKPGVATITATYKDQTVTMTVNVTRDPTIQRIFIQTKTITSTPWYTPKQIAYYINWGYSGMGELVWSSSDETVARVDQDGFVHSGKPGTCVITLSDGVNSDTCVVTVLESNYTCGDLSRSAPVHIRATQGDTMVNTDKKKKV